MWAIRGRIVALLRRGLLTADSLVVFVRVSAELGDAQANFLDLQRMGPSR